MREIIKMAQDELMNAKSEMEQQKIVKIIISYRKNPLLVLMLSNFSMLNFYSIKLKFNSKMNDD